MLKLKKILLKPRPGKVGPMDSAQNVPQLGGGQQLIYNEDAIKVDDVGAGAFDRFNSPGILKKSLSVKIAQRSFTVKYCLKNTKTVTLKP